MKLNWFLRSVLMEEAGDGTGGGGGGDSTALTVSTGTAVATTDGDGTDDTGGGDTSVAVADNQQIFEGGKLSQSAAKTFRQMEKANPAARTLITEAQRAMGGWAKVKAIFGSKPFDRINQLRKLEREVGGEAGLKSMRATVEDMEKSDSLYEKADPQLIALMTESPAGKQAFVNIFPHAVAKVRELAPQTYTKWLGMQFLNTIEKLEVTLKNSAGAVISNEPIDMPFRLRRVFGQLPPTDEHGKFVGGTMTAEQEQAIYTDLANIYAWIEKLRTWANATPEDLTPSQEDAGKGRIAEAEKAANEAVQNSWKVQRDAICNDIITEEVRKQTKGTDLSATIMADITARARKSINGIRKAKPDNERKVKAFFDSKDVKGYIAYNRGIVQDNVQAAVEKAAGLYAKKSTRRTGQPQQAAPAATGAPAAQTQPAAQAGKVTRLTPQQAEQLGGKQGTRWMKQRIGNNPGTTTEMITKGQQMLRKGNPLNLPEGTVVQFP